MEKFSEILTEAVRGGTCLSVILSRPRPDSDHMLDKVTIRPAVVGGTSKYQFQVRSGKRETHENLASQDTAVRILELFRTAFADCRLFTTEANYSARGRNDGTVRIKKSPPSKRPGKSAHDRSKHYLIPENQPCAFLAEIGVMNAAGHVRAARYHKFRQINRFLELVDDVIEFLPPQGTLNIVDFGSGKSYLTFALHHLLTNIHARRVQMVGLDHNSEIVAECGQIAGRLGCDGLTFREGDIADYDPDASLDLAVSLHACDTATDDALAKAVGWNASVILAVPCCQHELAEKMDNNVLPLVAQHGILKDRFAALATDALRAGALEVCGYKTQVVEFIDMEHTAKNVLIRAVKRRSSLPDAGEKIESFRNFKKMLGLDQIYLEQLLASELAE